MSKKALAACLVALAVVFTGGIVTFNRTIQIKGGTTQFEEDDDDTFKLNTSEKVYSDIEKAEKTLTFEVKLPIKAFEENSINSYKIKTILQKNILEMSFKSNDNISVKDFLFYEFKGEAENVSDIITAMERPNAPYDHTISVKSEEKTIGNKVGQDITISIDKVKEKEDDEDLNYQISKYFVWQEDDINYAIKYNFTTYEFTNSNIDEDKISEIISSLVDSETENGKYDISKINEMGIYDEEDLQKATDIIGFIPKIQLKLNNAVVMNNCMLSVIENKNEQIVNPGYKIQSFYYGTNENIEITQSKFDENNVYNELKTNGSFEQLNKKVYTNTIKIDDVEVIKYVNNIGNEKEIGLLWCKDGIYYKVICRTTRSTESYEYIVKSILNYKENE